MKDYWVNIVLPEPGMTITVGDYKQAVIDAKGSKKKAICSLGGVSKRSCVIANGYVTRL